MSINSDQFSLIDPNDSFSFESHNLVKLYQTAFDWKTLPNH